MGGAEAVCCHERRYLPLPPLSLFLSLHVSLSLSLSVCKYLSLSISTSLCLYLSLSLSLHFFLDVSSGKMEVFEDVDDTRVVTPPASTSFCRSQAFEAERVRQKKLSL